MKASYSSTIGRPRLHLKDDASGLILDLQPPREVMVDMVRENARWLLHNGDCSEIEALREIFAEGLPHAEAMLACKPV